MQARLWKDRREVLGSVYNHEALPSIPFLLDIEHEKLSLLQRSLGVPMWTEELSPKSHCRDWTGEGGVAANILIQHEFQKVDVD